MADIDYPSTLPTPARSGYGLQHVSPFARTTMATGRARQRRTFQSVPSAVTLTWTMRNEEAQVFEGWFAYDITDGADWFNIDLKAPVGTLAPYECRFMEMYQGPELFGLDMWRFTAEVEIRERPILDQTWYQFGQEFILGSSIIDVALNSKWPLA